MSHLELPCARCGHKLVAVSAEGLADSVKEHKRYHLWLDHQEMMQTRARTLAHADAMTWTGDE